MTDQRPELIWQENDLPVAAAFDDSYYSHADGLAETEYVFLAGNDLPARFRSGFHVAEIGFGTGLNLAALWRLWDQSGTQGVLHFTSFEAFPMEPRDMHRALDHWPELAPYVQAIAQGGTYIRTETLNARIIIGDARDTLPDWDGMADAWFLDGFAPAKNPELWEDPLMQAVGLHTNTDGSFATYTAAGHVRRALADAGFAVSRIPGFRGKRHMTRGTMRP